MFKIGDKFKTTIDLEWGDGITIKKDTIIDVTGTEQIFNWETIQFIHNGHQLRLIPILGDFISAVKVEQSQFEFEFNW